MKKEGFVSIEDVKGNKVEHGELVLCEWNSYSSGMSMFSAVTDNRTLKKTENGWVIENEHKQEATSHTKKLYRADDDMINKIALIAERENLPAWDELYIDSQKDPRPMVLDYSSSAAIVLVYDDSSVGGRPYVRFYIQFDLASFFGGGSVIDEITQMFKEAMNDQALISSEELPVNRRGAFGPGGFMGMVIPQTQQQGEGTWVCSECGCSGNTGKYCPQCGSPRK
ncbi:MAG: hypothetical protein J5956_13200 [Ruminococcus sp.]|nr:hypothetical protein [Ruminococcus sp.]